MSHAPSTSAASVRMVLLFAWLTIFGGKLTTIGSFGTDLPYWDQWAKEGEHILIPWFKDQPFLKALFSPHNEHRIVPTLLLNLGLVVGGGQWDARVQCLASAAVHATLLVGVAAWLWRRTQLPWRLGGVLIAVTIGALPLAWDNVLGGFQSQYYFLAGASLLAVERLLEARPFSVGWWLGVGAAFLALVCMGSGLLVSMPVLLLLAVRWLRGEGRRRDHLCTAAAALSVLAVGLWLHTAAPWHETLHAKSLMELTSYLLRSMAWPLPEHPGFGLLVWGPWAAVAVRRMLGIRVAGDDVLVAGGLWILSQAAAVAYSRAGASAMPASRYGDISSLGLLVCYCSLAQLTAARSVRLRLGAAVVAALGAVAAMVVAVGPVWRTDLPIRKGQYWTFEDSVRRFIADDNFAVFEKSPLPFPLADWLARILRDPGIRAAMPASAGASLAQADQITLGRTSGTPLSNGDWTSGPLPPVAPYWRLEVAGRFNPASTSMRLLAGDGRVLREVPLPEKIDQRRAEIVLAAPGESSRIQLHLGADDEVILVLPRAMSRWSWWAWQLASVGRPWFCVAAIALILGGVWSVYGREALDTADVPSPS
ncbi:MAG: hypothetical protein JNN01_18315 [Opitutaceae bacterium]|nr:hypothetical protein [Opitutaceae bacterium]